MSVDAIVLAGGLGTRLRSVVSDRPKVLAEVGGVPFLTHVLDHLVEAGVQSFVLSVGYLWEQIAESIGTRYRDASVAYSVEEVPLGTGGALRKALHRVHTDEAFVANGDTYFGLRLDSLLDCHRGHDADVSIALKRLQHVDRYGVVEVDDDHRVVRFREKADDTDVHINGGIYVVARSLFDDWDGSERFSFERDFLELRLDEVRVVGCPLEGPFIDIGVPEDYRRAAEVLSSRR